MTSTTEAGAADDFRVTTRAALGALLSARRADHRNTVMGAGSDDFESRPPDMGGEWVRGRRRDRWPGQ